MYELKEKDIGKGLNVNRYMGISDIPHILLESSFSANAKLVWIALKDLSKWDAFVEEDNINEKRMNLPLSVRYKINIESITRFTNLSEKEIKEAVSEMLNKLLVINKDQTIQLYTPHDPNVVFEISSEE